LVFGEDLGQMKNRIELAEYFAKLGFTKGAEIGVATGRYSEILLQKIENLNLLCVDPFYRQGHYEKTLERLLPLYKAMAHIMKETSMEAVIKVPDNSLDFVFIDGNHQFNHVMEDIIGWGRKVRRGGIISGHDYYHFHNSGVIEAVNKYTEVHRLDLHLTEWNTDGHKDDRFPCWWIQL
jgi:predicted O-methyltransferase YrrM